MTAKNNENASLSADTADTAPAREGERMAKLASELASEIRGEFQAGRTGAARAAASESDRALLIEALELAREDGRREVDRAVRQARRAAVRALYK